METTLSPSRRRDPVHQFSIFTENKVGKLNEWIQRLGAEDIHIIAICMLDSTECTIMRFIPDYPDQARQFLEEHGYPYTETEILVAEIATEAQIRHVTAALVEAEINIHYIYPLVARPEGKSALALHVEDLELAASALHNRGIRALNQADIAR